MSTRGENLIFLISQPRAGSTMLQRMLGNHPAIHTVGEPWLMLHPLYGLRSEGYDAEYSAPTARLAVREFLGTIPRGEEEYVEGVRRMCAHLYGQALAASGKRYFLDKTPRYYLVIPELLSVFPEAHYIILLRNPLATLHSIIKTWIKDQWGWLYYYRNDLIKAPRLLMEGATLAGARSLVVHYEQLLANPQHELRRICEKLGEDFTGEMIEANGQNLPHWRYGDQQGVYRHTRPVALNAQKWVEALSEPQFWRVADDYLRRLGRERVEEMGYDYAELQDALDSHSPTRTRRWLTFSLDWYLERQMEKRPRWERGVARLKHLLRRQRAASGAAAAETESQPALAPVAPGDLPHA
ncbi:MAG TPA: sulfotransferase [Pyrinomonadaceae bacterium]|jgi:hypothetical protein